jgi:hypothetical protein
MAVMQRAICNQHAAEIVEPGRAPGAIVSDFTT